MKSIFRKFGCVPVFVIAVISGPNLRAQQPAAVLPDTPQVNDLHQLEIRVLVGGGVAARVKARNWSQLFQKAGHLVTIETDNGGKKIGIHPRKTRRRSVVEIVGLVDRRSVLRLGEKEFRLGDVQPLKMFLEDLAKNGVEGPIRRRPTWGLSISQYETALKLLSTEVKNEIYLSSPVETVKALQLPPEFRVTWSGDAQEVALSQQHGTGVIDLRRVSTGTGLAIAMAQFGLGFRIMKEYRRSGFLLEVDVGNESGNLWPIGWKNKQSLTVVLPKLYKRVTVDLPDEKVAEVVELIADRIEVPHFVSRQRLLENDIDYGQVKYSAPFERRSPSGLLRSIGGRLKMGIEVRTDEAGQLFLWCTTADDQNAWKKRFAHVVPGKK